MKPSVLYRIASGLLVLFAIGHTAGFWQTDPDWHADAVVASMKAVHFNADVFSRTYWDFFLAAGFHVGAYLLFSAVLAWQLGGLTNDTLRAMSIVTWTFAILFVGVAAVSWIYLFYIPVIFAALVSACLIAAAYTARRSPAPAN